MIPVITLVGRPNVGKSTLFNRLTHTHDALVADFSGLTRDRQYGHAKVEGQEFIVIDTGGINNSSDANSIEACIAKQSFLAIEEADIVLFIVDAFTGLMPGDQILAKHLRMCKKKIFLIANKIYGLNTDSVIADFYSIGLGKVYLIDALHGRGVTLLLKTVILPWIKEILLQKFLLKEGENKIYYTTMNVKKTSGNINIEVNNLNPMSLPVPVKIAIIGQLNVGKSTLTNCILGEDRMIAYNMPGTTRDSIYIPMKFNEREYVLIDTAGVRKRRKIIETVEKFSVIKTLKAINDANVVLLLIDANRGISDQDLSLLSFVLNSGRSLVIAVNKWDQLSKEVKNKVKEALNFRLAFIDFVRVHFISALYGRGVSNLFESINEAYDCSMSHVSASVLTRIMNTATTSHQPPLVQGRRVKLKYAHIGDYNPLVIVIHGKRVKDLPDSYKRYLTNYFRRSIKVKGTPIQLQFKEGKNPFCNK